MKNKKKLSLILAISIFAGILLLDLLTKGLIISKLISNVGDSVEVIPNFINFIYVKNKGAAWGILAGRPVFLILISVVVLSLLITFYLLRLKKTREKSSILFGISIGLVSGGCVGNLFDRIAFGYVRDFINFQFMDFPVFNFADIALTIGMIILIIYFIFYYQKEEAFLKNEIKQNENNVQDCILISNFQDLMPISDKENAEKENEEFISKDESGEGGKDEG